MATPVLEAKPAARGTVGRNFSNLIASDSIAKVGLFLAIVLLGRRLSLDEFGVYNYIQSIVITLVFCTDLGVEWYGTRESSRLRRTGHFNEAVNSLLAFRVACLILVLAGTAIAMGLGFARSQRWALGAMMPAVLAGAASLEWLMLGVEQVQFTAMGRILRTACFLLLIILCVHGSSGLVAACWSYAVGMTAGSVYLWWAAIRKIGLRFHFGVSIGFGRILRQTLPFAFYAYLPQCLFFAALFVLHHTADNAGLGGFSAIYRIAYTILLVMLPAVNSLFPQMVRANDADRRRHMGEVSWIVTSGALGVALVLGILNGPIMAGLFHAEVAQASRLFAWCYAMVPIMGYVVVASSYAISSGHERAIPMAVIPGIGVEVFSFFALKHWIPAQQSLAAAMSLGALVMTAVLFAALRIRPAHVAGPLLRVGTAAALVAGGLWEVRPLIPGSPYFGLGAVALLGLVAEAVMLTSLGPKMIRETVAGLLDLGAREGGASV